jgi:predicted KAP-like P-loop ATPase
MRNDKPIKSPGEDALERSRFVDAAFKTIANIQDLNCYIIGLYGKWGTGKTSIIELLKSKFKSNDYYAVYFNPWSFETREALMIELFKKIYIGVKREENLKPKLKQVGKFLKKTADYIYPKG